MSSLPSAVNSLVRQRHCAGTYKHEARAGESRTTQRPCLHAVLVFSGIPMQSGSVQLVLLLSLAIVGCSKGDRLPTYETTGKVAYQDGSPLEGGTIIFESIDQPVTARATIGMDGTFTLGTYEEDDGAVAGKHRVAIAPAMDMTIDRDEVRPPKLIHDRFRDVETSGLEFEVVDGGLNEFEVQVRKR